VCRHAQGSVGRRNAALSCHYSPVLILGLLLAVLIGISLGMLGGGGSILTVPVLVYVLGFEAKQAIAMSLPVVGLTSLIGAYIHWRLGNVRARTAVSFGVLTMIGAFGGAKLAMFLSGAVQLLLLSAAMLAAAVSMLRGAPVVRDTGAPAAQARFAMLVLVALAVGVLTGLVGIGGGFLVVPALVLLANVPMREAVGTSLLVIAMNTASGFAGYLGTVSIDWRFLAGFTAAAITGALIGTVLAARVPQGTLKRAFAFFLLGMGAFVLYRNRSAFSASSEPGPVSMSHSNPTETTT
jgi:uncharacterized protein